MNNLKKCIKCSTDFLPNSAPQKYCAPCSKEREKERKRNWYIKNNPNAYQEKPKHCSVCDSPVSAHFENKPYCNKHYLRLYNNGTLQKVGRKKNTYLIDGDVVIMTTHKGENFLFDKSDLERVSKQSWCISKTGYLVSNINKKTIKLHRFILELTEPKVAVDHINGDPMDNRRSNLRICDNVENTRNSKVSKNNTSGYPGVGQTPTGRYRARINVNRKEIRIGTFDTFEEAKQARIAAELKYFGEFSPSLNVIE